MNVSEIITDALMYPLNNIKALLIYVVLGIIAGLAVGGTVVGVATGTAANNAWLTGGAGIIGLIISIVLFLLIDGYQLDIVKYGINRDPGAPGIDVVRQVTNAIKLIIVYIVYFIVPVIIAALLFFLLGKGILTIIIAAIIAIVFTLAEFMAKCRLAKTDSLGEALAIGSAIGDISRVGLVKILLTVIVVFVIAFIAGLIVVGISNLNSTIGSILMGIFGIYFAFFVNRASGLLYSGV